jgi:hypothetical protein
MADYSSARQVVQSERKPLAVFLGRGENGYEKVCRDGSLSKTAQDALRNSYVSVYVDTTSSAGKRLAAAFGITKPAGLVISDRGGAKQAFHHDGALTASDLKRALTRFADPNVVVSHTETVSPQTSGASSVPNAVAPARPSYYLPPNAGFQPSFAPAMGFGGGGCRT